MPGKATVCELNVMELATSSPNGCFFIKLGKTVGGVRRALDTGVTQANAMHTTKINALRMAKNGAR